MTLLEFNSVALAVFGAIGMMFGLDATTRWAGVVCVGLGIGALL
jgi:hypothetical protein